MKCRHFGSCGGCTYQDLSYSEQLEEKTKKLKELLSFYQIDTKILPIQTGPQWYYRNKMEFTFSWDSEKNISICGLHKKDQKRKVVDIEECLIFSPHAGKILAKVKEFVREMNYSSYNKFTHRGFLRNLIVRETKFTNQIMLGIVTTSQEKLDGSVLVKKLQELDIFPRIKSIFWIINDRLSDAVIFEQKNLLCGQDYIEENLGKFVFKIYIDSFFQVNPFLMKKLYERIEEYGEFSKDEKVLDLFCGVGSIGIFIAPHVGMVWGVEINENIVKNAWENARINNVNNISFITEDVRRFLGLRKKELKDKIDCIIVNPPRSGLSKKIRSRIMEIRPPRLFYSSCNPLTLCEDLSDFSRIYRIELIEPFDFFPHTPHLESLVVLKLKCKN